MSADPHIASLAHADSIGQMAAFFPGLGKGDLPNRSRSAAQGRGTALS